jgi:hypothetical protein
MSEQERKQFDEWRERFIAEHGHMPTEADAWQARAALAQQVAGTAAQAPAPAHAHEADLPHYVPHGRTTKRFFSYCPDNGVEFHATAQEAQEATRIDIAEYRKDCNFNGEWADEVEHCYWGEVKGRAEATEPDENGGVDYLLKSVHPPAPAPVELTKEQAEALHALDALAERGFKPPIGALIELLERAAASPAPAHEPADLRFSWMDFQQIGDVPAVDEAIRNLLDDPTEDNSTCMVRAICEAAADRLVTLVATQAPAVGAESDHAEFEVWEGDELYASASGPRAQAWDAALRYADQCYGGDIVRVFEVSRVERSDEYQPPVQGTGGGNV